VSLEEYGRVRACTTPVNEGMRVSRSTVQP
jgi:NADH dehydrogenase/NADH:ubiquinone oxidoreductase subunit G